MADETGAEHGAGDDTKSLREVAEEGHGEDTRSLRSIVEESYAEQIKADDDDDAGEGNDPKPGEGGDKPTGQDVKPAEGEGGETPPDDKPKAGDDNFKPGTMEAPANWKISDREMFSKLSQEAQNFLLERSRGMEAAHTQRSQVLAQQMQALAPWQQFETKWNAYFQQLGAAAPIAVDALLSKEYQLRTGSNAQKVQILRDLIAEYQIAAPDANAPAPDPQVAQLQQQIWQMQNGWQQQQAQALQQQQAVQQARVAQTTQTLHAFQTEVDDEGNLAHPYFGEVEQDMTRLAQADLAAGVQPELNSLYERAIWSNPIVRQKIQEAEAAHREAEQRAEAERLEAEKREKAKKARRAGSSISGAGAPAGDQPEGIREILEAEMKRQLAA